MVQYLQKPPKFLIYWKLNLFSGAFSRFSRSRSGSQCLTIGGFQSEYVRHYYYLGCRCSRVFTQWFIAVQEPPSVWLKAAGAACWTVMRITDPLTQESSTTNALNEKIKLKKYTTVFIVIQSLYLSLNMSKSSWAPFLSAMTENDIYVFPNFNKLHFF